MKYKCESCGDVFEGNEFGPFGSGQIKLGKAPTHTLCGGVLIPIPEVLNSESHSEPEEIQRLHESADHLAKRITELREAVDADKEDAQAMATASIKRELERCRALLGEIEAEYLPPQFGKETEG